MPNSFPSASPCLHVIYQLLPNQNLERVSPPISLRRAEKLLIFQAEKSRFVKEKQQDHRPEPEQN